MKKIFLLLPIVVLVLSPLTFAQLAAPGADNTPKVGDKAPDFAPLKDFAGKKKVLLAFFPAAFTGG
jgi:hypothetical protein